MKIGDKVTFKDRVTRVSQEGLIRKISDDGTKALVCVSHKHSREWVKIEKLERL